MSHIPEYSNISRNITLPYKGYKLMPLEGKRIRAIRVLRKANHHIPKSFVWVGEEHRDLYRYIDAWCDGNQLLRESYESNGFATDVEFSEPPAGTTLVELSPHLVLSVLRGEMPLYVSHDTVIRFRSSTDYSTTKTGGKRRYGKFVASEFLAAIADRELEQAYAQAVHQCALSGKPVMMNDTFPTPKKSDGLSFVLPGDANLIEAEKRGLGVHVPASHDTAEEQKPAEKVHESLVSTVENCGITEVVSLASGGAREYYIKRRYDREMVLLSTATAWSLDGPWTAY